MFALHWHFGDVPSVERECTKYVLQPACGPLLFVLLLGRQPAAEKSEMLRTVNSVHCSHCVCLSCCIFRSLKFLIFSQFFHSRWASILPSLFRNIFQTITIWQMQRSSASRVSESNRKGKIDTELKLALTLPKAEKLSRSITNSYLIKMVSFSSCAFHHCILDMNDNRIIIAMLLLLRSNKNDDLHITSIWFS